MCVRISVLSSSLVALPSCLIWVLLVHVCAPVPLLREVECAYLSALGEAKRISSTTGEGKDPYADNSWVVCLGGGLSSVGSSSQSRAASQVRRGVETHMSLPAPLPALVPHRCPSTCALRVLAIVPIQQSFRSGAVCALRVARDAGARSARSLARAGRSGAPLERKPLARRSRRTLPR